MKPVIYLVAAIFLSVCVYAFIQYVPISYKTVPVEQASVDVDGPLKKAIDKKTTLFCDIESFWSKYDIWGDTDTVYGSAQSGEEHDEATEHTADEDVSCDEQRDEAVSQ